MRTPRRLFPTSLSSFLPLKEYFIRNKRALMIGLVSLLIMDFLQVLIPQVIKRAVDLLAMDAPNPGSLLILHGLVIVGIAVMIAFFRFIWRTLLLGNARGIEKGLRKRLYNHIQKLSPSFFRRTPTGDIMARSINDIHAVRMASGMGLVALTDGLVLGICAIAFMIMINPLLAVISIIPAPLVMLFTKMLTKRMAIGFERVQGAFSDLTENVRESFSGIRIVKAFNREAWQHERIRRSGQAYIAENMNLARSLALFFPIMAVFTNTGLAIVIWLGGRLTIMGDITAGDFVAFISYLNLLTWPIMAMGWVTNLIQRAGASMRRINKVLDENPEITDTDGSRPVDKIRGKITIRGLEIRYKGQETPALRDIHLDFKRGETTAVVGRIGAGKTTLLHTLPRLIEIPRGSVFLDGVDILDITLHSLRKAFGFVTQQNVILSDTLRYNVVFGRDNISETDIEEALRISHFWNEIQAMEDGLDTVLGEKGITLSGGQRQRLTLARALIGDPPILVLDDALSMVDVRTERMIFERLFDLRGDATNLIVTHRASTILKADHIVVLEKGRVAEEGTHGELLSAGGLYHSLYEEELIARELEKQDMKT